MYAPTTELQEAQQLEQYPAEYFPQQLQDFCSPGGMPPPPPMLHHLPLNQHSSFVPPQLQQANCDIAYCATQWMYYDDGQQYAQYRACCIQEAYTFSSIKQSDSSSPHPTPTLPPLTPPLTRHQHQLQIQQQQQLQQRGGADKLLDSSSSSSSSSSTAILNSIGPKPSQSESRMPGRHPHPPSGNNSKLKHKCPFDGCPWRFATPYKLRRHIKSHTKETPFVCKECGRGFSVRYNLLMHIQTIHSQPQRFKCPMKGCKEAFHTQPRLNGHLRRVHKKDWKTMQLPKLEGGEGKQGGSGGGSRSSSTSSDDSVEAVPKTQRYECLQCSCVFSSQAKLNTHQKSHSTDKSFKCTMQGCNKTFPTKEKLTKHQELHKQPKQFCCPHENCNRVFLRQSHLKNHLKIHAQDYFVCPVMDCSEKFVSEADYNVHINTHMNYGHKCGVAGCGHTFLTRKRLELHCRVMHGLELHGHQPLLTVPLGHASPTLIPHSQQSPPHPPIFTASTTCPLSHNVLFNVEEGLRDVDLPGLSADEIETILSEKSNWSGEQFKNLFHSAVELSELEAKLFSGSGYESDSGYSTYDVSPITSSAPMQFGACRASSSSYRSISPALTPVNPSPYISLSSSNPFQFGQSPMHMSMQTATTPLPHSASPDGEFTFFPPVTPTYHPSLQSVPSTPHTVLTPTQDGYMMQGGPFPMQVTTQYQREFQVPPYAPVLPDLRQPQPQQESYGIEFADILGESQGVKDSSMQDQCSEMQRRQRISSLSLLPPQNMAEVKVELVDQKPCTNVSSASSCASACAMATPVPTTSARPFPASVKLENTSSEENPCTMSSCKISQQPPHSTHASQSTASTSSPQLKSFLDTCSKLPSLQELVSSGVHPTVVVVTVSTALAALEEQTQGPKSQSSKLVQKLSIKEGPYDIPQLHSRIEKLTPEQSERLADTRLISAAKQLATQHLESLAAARKKNEKQASCSSQKAQCSNTAVSVTKTTVKASVTVKTVSKTQQKSGGVVRVGAGSHMKGSHKKKSQWPRSMNKANLMAFREHILNKLKRGQGEAQQQRSCSPTHPSGGAPGSSPSDMSCDGDVPVQVRCSSEPADFFSRQVHTDSSLSPLQASQSAGNVSYKLLKHIDLDYSSDNMHLDFNPDILLTSSVLPDNLLTDMEIDSLASISSPSEHNLVQFLCDPSPPSSVTSPIDNMEDLDSIQDFLSGNSESDMSSSATHFTESSFTGPSSMHKSSYSPVHSPTTTTTTAAPQQQSTLTTPAMPGENATCSMADVASLFIANVESVPPEEAPIVLEDSLESVFQRPTDPLLACGSRLHW